MTTLALGNRRLLKLAAILDTADAEHRERGEPTYKQQSFIHDCGTPACALAHWAAANPRRWRFDPNSGSPRLRGSDRVNVFDPPAFDDFFISPNDWDELFGGRGCGNAKTAKQAAAYIRKFVARRQREATRSKGK